MMHSEYTESKLSKGQHFLGKLGYATLGFTLAALIWTGICTLYFHYESLGYGRTDYSIFLRVYLGTAVVICPFLAWQLQTKRYTFLVTFGVTLGLSTLPAIFWFVVTLFAIVAVTPFA